MSFLLDALRKSENQKRIGDIPTIHSTGDLMSHSRNLGRRGLLILILLPAVTVVAWYFWQASEPAVEPVTVEPAEMMVEEMVADQAEEQIVANEAVKNGVLPAFPESVESRNTRHHERTAVESFSTPTNRKAEGSTAMALAINSLHSSEARAEVIVEEKPLDVTAAETTRQQPEQSRQAQLDTISYWQLPEPVRAELPPLKISVLVFAERPEDRFILLNGRRVAEGEEPDPGLVLKQIRREGAVFSYRLYHFLVSR